MEMHLVVRFSQATVGPSLKLSEVQELKCKSIMRISPYVQRKNIPLYIHFDVLAAATPFASLLMQISGGISLKRY
jgi:hypothetical protein